MLWLGDADVSMVVAIASGLVEGAMRGGCKMDGGRWEIQGDWEKV